MEDSLAFKITGAEKSVNDVSIDKIEDAGKEVWQNILSTTKVDDSNYENIRSIQENFGTIEPNKKKMKMAQAKLQNGYQILQHGAVLSCKLR